MRSSLAHGGEAANVIDGLYRQELGRDADAAGRAAYQDRFADGWNIADVRRDLVYSDEARIGFDGAWYLRQNPDVAAAGLDPYLHYIDRGWQEGRDPNAWFDGRFYLAANPDVARGSLDPLTHYVALGRYEGRAAYDVRLDAVGEVEARAAVESSRRRGDAGAVQALYRSVLGRDAGA